MANFGSSFVQFVQFVQFVVSTVFVLRASFVPFVLKKFGSPHGFTHREKNWQRDTYGDGGETRGINGDSSRRRRLCPEHDHRDRLQFVSRSLVASPSAASSRAVSNTSSQGFFSPVGGSLNVIGLP